MARATEEDSDSGQYNPDLYEKPYEAPETEETYTEAAEEAAEPSEPEAETPTAPEVPAAPAPLPEVVAAAPPVAVAPFPYPLLYAHQYNPLVYSAPHFYRSAIFPSFIL